jgi:PAS domain-containing protein/putative methionine-R-sulfoxide reductase with GAF domain
MTTARQTRISILANSAICRLAADSVYEFSLIVSGRGTISFANDLLLRATQHRLEGVRGRPFSALIRKPDGRVFTSTFLRPRSASNPQRKNFSIVTRDGRRFSCRGKVYYFAAAGKDAGGALVLGDRVRIRSAATDDVLADRGRAAGLVASITDGLCVVDARGTIVSANGALARLAALHPADMVGVAPPYPWLGGAENHRLAGALSGVVRSGTPAHLLIVLKREDDRPLALSFSISPLPDIPGMFLASIRDISDIHPVREHEMAEKRIERLREQVRRNAVRLKTLQEINRSVLRSGSLSAVFKRITDGVGTLVDHDLAGIYVFEGDEKILRPRMLSKLTPFSRRLGKLPLTLGEGIVGSAAVSGAVVLVNDAHKDPRSVYPPGMKPEIEHIIAAPLRGRQSTYGILTVARNRYPGFHEEDAQIVQSFADAASIAIENIRLHGELGLASVKPPEPENGSRPPAAGRREHRMSGAGGSILPDPSRRDPPDHVADEAGAGGDMGASG